MNLKGLIKELKEVVETKVDNLIYFYEMSQPEGKIRENIRNFSTLIIKHLLKILMYGNQTSIHHWCSEINSWLEQCTEIKIKKKNRYPNGKEVNKWLLTYWTHPSDIEKIRINIEKKYGKTSSSNEALYEKVILSLNELCKNINNLTINEIEQIVTKFMN